jgi:RNA polymerase sigma-70 factor, ECF subfamily
MTVISSQTALARTLLNEPLRAVNVCHPCGHQQARTDSIQARERHSFMATTAASLITTQTVSDLQPALLSVALRMVARREDAEDLVQETWSSAWQSAATFEGRSSLRTWLTGILRRRAADRYRRERSSEVLDEESCAADLPAACDRLAEQAAAARATSALAELPPLERSAITLCDIDDLERDAAAEQMAVTRGHLRVLLHRARRRLGAELRAQGVDSSLYF